MANEGFNPDDLRDYKAELAKIMELQNKATDGLSGFNSILKEIKEVSRNLKTIKQQEAKLEAEIIAINKQKRKLLAQANTKEKRNAVLLSEEYQSLVKANVERREGLKIAGKETTKLKENAAVLAESANSANLMSASIVSAGRGAIGAFKSLKDISKTLLSQQKAVQLTEQSMGILSKSSNAFRMNMYKAAGTTQQLGVSAGDLSKMQGAYSDQVGRSVQLSEQGLVAMAEMSKGTMMGAEGAAEMAASMDSFGISVVGAKDIVEDMMNTSSKMGVNSVKVTANLKKNMQLANRFHFKDGVKGMVRLAAAAAKMHLDMEGIAGMADKVFRPEGAVEMAARLQTMGGEFAKLGDPFSLMFKARNDFEGFANDVGAATAEFARFNSETGQFDISGAGLDRIKEIADITGISADKLAEMGRETAKINQIESKVAPGLDDDSTAFISSIAQFDETTGEWKAYFDGQEQNIKNLNAERVKEMIAEKATLEERAKQAQTFDETWKNLKNTFKTLLFPILDGLSEGLKKPLHQFMTWAKKSGGFEKLFNSAKKIGESVGEAVKWISEFVTNNPFTALGSIIAGMGLFKAAQWVANGVSLGMGFNMSANVGGGGGGIGDMFGRRGGGGKFGKAMKKGGFSRGANGRLMKGAKGGGFMKGAKGMKLGGGMGMKGVGLGLGLGAAGMGMDYARNNWMDDPDSDWGKAMGVGSSALEGAGMGMMLGPWGALAGGILGAGYGAFKEYSQEDKRGGISKYDDVIMRSGQAPIGIDKNDDVLAAKKGGAVDKAMAGATSGGGKTSGNISFSPITINGKLELVGDGVSGEIDLSDPIFMRDLSKVIQEEVRKSIGGGKLNPNPM
jgi:hypothetical protein